MSSERVPAAPQGRGVGGMSTLHLIRLPIDAPRLVRFGIEFGIPQDETMGYTLHAWLAALFGDRAPKPFRYFERRQEVLAYAPYEAEALLEQARAFAHPTAWAALNPQGVASKPMPCEWKAGKRLWLESLVCPVSRKENEEKDIYLRAIENHTGQAGATSRAEVYRQWFAKQIGHAVRVHWVEVQGMRARAPGLRRDRKSGNQLRIVERPQAWIGAEVTITDPAAFAAMLARGIGRHRAFGYGMLLLKPAGVP